MPTYSYRCTACGNEFDVRQSFSDAPLTVCERCGGALRKLFNSVGIVFKGSGFYHNDSKSSSQGLHSSERSGGEEGDGRENEAETPQSRADAGEIHATRLVGKPRPPRSATGLCARRRPEPGLWTAVVGGRHQSRGPAHRRRPCGR